ncbi:MAG: hypothetical protein AB9846_15815 [Tenuifilaceae bacterium]
MNKTLVVSFLLVLLVYIGFTVINQENLSNQTENPEYQKYIKEYRKSVNEKFVESFDNNEGNTNYKLEYKKSNLPGTTGNFEGPQVHLKAIKFHKELLTSKDVGERLKHFDPVSAHFDPDHSYYGLPDVKIGVKDVRLYEIEKGPLAKYLSLGSESEPKPYKVYRKPIIDDSTGLVSKFLVMQLWLTEFEVNIDIRPDKDIPINISDSELNNTKYPGFWYGSSQSFLKLKELDKEYRDFRYSDLSFILEIIPDNSPIYVKTSNGSSSKADFAIGAIYCKNAQIGNEPNVQRISTNVHAGQPLFLNNEFDYEKMNTNLNNFSDNLETSANRMIEIKSNNNDFIWNKPYYVKLFFNNLGAWRSGIFNQNHFHDQVSYSFLMPIFVVGSWDVIIPQEILPNWDPPKPYIKKVTLKNLLPFWNSGILGKLGSIIIVVLLVFLGIFIIIPNLPLLIKRLFSSK